MLNQSKPSENSEIKSYKDVHIRKDIYEFIKYVRDKGIVLTKRENNIPIPVARKLSKLMTFTIKEPQDEDDIAYPWIELIYSLCKELNLVNKEVDRWEDNITGYYYRKWDRPSYPEFDIHLMENYWDEYLELKPVEKEWRIFYAFSRIIESEFYGVGVWASGSSYRDRFSTSGSGINAQDRIAYGPLRNKLLAILKPLAAEKWYEVKSLIKHIKDYYPNLILDHTNRSHINRGYVRNSNNFYHCFYETKDPEGWGREIEVDEKDNDAFERVEGRYITYFLETIPLIMNIVELAYSREKPSIFPPINHINHFKISPQGKEMLSGEIKTEATSQIKILPTFEIFIPIDEFDEKIFFKLEKYAKIISSDKMYQLKINKKQILSQLEKGEQIEDIIQFFKDLSKLPQNIQYELGSYGTHSDKILAITGTSILEVPNHQTSHLFEANYPEYIISQMGKKHFLIKKADKLYTALIRDGHLPKLIDYDDTKRKLDIDFISDNNAELKFRNSDIFLKKDFTKYAKLIEDKENTEIYDITETDTNNIKDILNLKNIENLPEAFKNSLKKSKKDAIQFKKVYLIQAKDKETIKSIKEILKKEQQKYWTIDENIIIGEKTVQTIKTHIDKNDI